jgi:hypothetical protein
MTAAQKAAKANFKKAIEYRKKTGVSLKEAFAHVYGKKVGAAPKKKYTKSQLEKIANNYAYATGGDLDKLTYRLLDNNNLVEDYLKGIKQFESKYKIKIGKAPKKAAKKVLKKAAPKKAAKKVVKKAAPKKAAKKKHTKYGKVKAHVRRVAGVHKDTKSHNVNIRVVSGLKDVNSYLLDQLNATLTRIKNTEEAISKLRVGILKKQYTKDDMPEAKKRLKKYSEYLKELKKHFTEIKKQIK